MRISFRHGIVKYQQPDFLNVTGSTVTLLAQDAPFVATIAHGSKNFLITEYADIPNAWSGIVPSVNQWLYIDIDTRTGARTLLLLYNGSGNSGVGYIQAFHATGVANGNIFHQFLYGNTGIGSITQSTTAAVAYNTTSDERLKENIKAANDALPVINTLEVKSFDWKNDTVHEPFGLIAQQVVKTVPNVVYQPLNPDEYMGIDYSKLVPMLIKSIQELNARVELLEAQLPK